MFDPTLPKENTLADAAQVDGTSTLPPRTPANASVNMMGNTLHFSFDISQGQEGLIGPAGPPFVQAVVDSVTPPQWAWALMAATCGLTLLSRVATMAAQVRKGVAAVTVAKDRKAFKARPLLKRWWMA